MPSRPEGPSDMADWNWDLLLSNWHATVLVVLFFLLILVGVVFSLTTNTIAHLALIPIVVAVIVVLVWRSLVRAQNPEEPAPLVTQEQQSHWRELGKLPLGITCIHCNYENLYTNDFCFNCKASLDDTKLAYLSGRKREGA